MATNQSVKLQMRLHPWQQKIVASLEPLPTGHSNLIKVSLVERGKQKISDTVTGILRSLRQREPMIWDPWIWRDQDSYHLFYLKGLAGKTPWWSVSEICGAISPDLKHWQDIGTILAPDPAHAWESGRICAGCTYKENDTYYLFYSAGGSGIDCKNEAIGLATSSDGLHYRRYSDRYLLKPEEDDPWYGRSSWSNHFHWRDPYIFKQAETGKYYLFTCASAHTPGNFQGCIGLAVADKITGPYQLLPPVVQAPIDAADDWPYYHMERPQVIYRDGKYHLFFSCFKMLMNPRWLQKVNSNRITNSSLYWYTADTIEGPYQPVNPDNFIVAGSEKTGLYGTNFLQVCSEPEEIIAYGWYHRLYALEVSPAFKVHWTHPPHQDRTGGGFLAIKPNDQTRNGKVAYQKAV